MKKFLIVSLIVFGLSGVGWMMLGHSPGKEYPLVDVTSAVSSSALALGGNLEEQRSASGSMIDAKRFWRIGTWFRKHSSQDAPTDVNKFQIRIGSDIISITCLSKVEEVYELQIEPSAKASRSSADLKREILKILPGMKFKL